MILPDDLLEIYENKKALYNQTASKSEQLALCQFLRDGHLDSQIRKLKRLYSNKARLLASELEKAFGNDVTVKKQDGKCEPPFGKNNILSEEQVTNDFFQSKTKSLEKIYILLIEEKNV